MRPSHGAPAGTRIPSVIAVAHVERWLDHGAFELDDAAAEGYFRSDAVRRELVEAFDQCSFPAGPVSARAANSFAVGLWRAGELRRARTAFEIAGGCFEGIPWSYVGAAWHARALEQSDP